MDHLSKVLLETIGGAGYVVNVEADSVTAIDEASGEQFIVRHDPESFYDACVELAVMVGIASLRMGSSQLMKGHLDAAIQ